MNEDTHKIVNSESCLQRVIQTHTIKKLDGNSEVSNNVFDNIKVDNMKITSSLNDIAFVTVTLSNI